MKKEESTVGPFARPRGTVPQHIHAPSTVVRSSNVDIFLASQTNLVGASFCTLLTITRYIVFTVLVSSRSLSLRTVAPEERSIGTELRT